MTNIRRYYDIGNVYFLTHVTYKRKPILVNHADILKNSLNRVKSEYVFEIIAFVILPNHFHILIDPDTNDVSKLMRKFKLTFSAGYRAIHKIDSGRAWQYRFWDHVIRNQEDMNRHIDYIHYNPVKHGLVTNPFDWEHSSILDYLKAGYYNKDWGIDKKVEIDGNFGE